MMDRNEIAKEQERLRQKLAKLEDEEKRLLAASGDTRLAEKLHDMQCGLSHEDRCAWFYETTRVVTQWNAVAHVRWLVKARNVMKELSDLSVDEIIRVVNAIK